MSDLDEKLRALHRRECGCGKYNPTRDCSMYINLRAAADLTLEAVEQPFQADIGRRGGGALVELASVTHVIRALRTRDGSTL